MRASEMQHEESSWRSCAPLTDHPLHMGDRASEMLLPLSRGRKPLSLAASRLHTFFRVCFSSFPVEAPIFVLLYLDRRPFVLL